VYYQSANPLIAGKNAIVALLRPGKAYDFDTVSMGLFSLLHAFRCIAPVPCGLACGRAGPDRHSEPVPMGSNSAAGERPRSAIRPRDVPQCRPRAANAALSGPRRTDRPGNGLVGRYLGRIGGIAAAPHIHDGYLTGIDVATCDGY